MEQFGDNSDEKAEFDRWIGRTKCMAHWTRRQIAWEAWKGAILVTYHPKTDPEWAEASRQQADLLHDIHTGKFPAPEPLPDNHPDSAWGKRMAEHNRVGPAPVVPIDAGPAPIPMVIHCPECRTRHIDVGEFATKPHHTHACQSCGFTWRPAVMATIGVQFLPGFKNRVPTQIFRNAEGERCATCDGTHAHVHGYDDKGEVPGRFDGSDWPAKTSPGAAPAADAHRPSERCPRWSCYKEAYYLGGKLISCTDSECANYDKEFMRKIEGGEGE